MDRDATRKTQQDITGLDQDDETLHITTNDVDTDTTTTDILKEDVDTDTTTADMAETADLANDELTFSLAEEQLQADVYETRIGTVSIAKRTEELPVEGVVDVDHDEVRLEHKEINEPVAKGEDPWYDGDTLVIPVYEEVLVTEKRLYLKEEIRITLAKETEQVEVRDTVRRQVVDVTSDTARPIDEETSTNS